MNIAYEKMLSLALIKGDKKSLLEIYEKIYYDYVKLVSFSVSKYINDEETIKDITNEVFVGFFNNAKNVKKSIKYYLLNSSRNLSLKYLEKENRIIKIEDIDDFVFEEKYQSNQDYLELINDLKKVLTNEEVEILIWHVVDGYSFKEIGKYLNKNYKAVNKIYERSINKYRNRKENV